MPPTARHRVLLPRVVPLAFMTAASGAFAEDAEPAMPLETIVVIGEKVGRTLEQTTRSVAVHSRRSLEERARSRPACVRRCSTAACAHASASITPAGVTSRCRYALPPGRSVAYGAPCVFGIQLDLRLP